MGVALCHRPHPRVPGRAVLAASLLTHSGGGSARQALGRGREREGEGGREGGREREGGKEGGRGREGKREGGRVIYETQRIVLKTSLPFVSIRESVQFKHFTINSPGTPWCGCAPIKTSTACNKTSETVYHSQSKTS